MNHILNEFYRVVKTNGFCVVVIGDARKRGVIPLGAYLELFGLHAGFNLWDLLIYDTRFGGKQVNKYRMIRSQQKKFHLTDHDYILVFQKRGKGWPSIEIEEILRTPTIA